MASNTLKQPAYTQPVSPRSTLSRLDKRRKFQPSEMYKHHLGGVNIKPTEQSHMLLGSFTYEHPPKGFSICIHPDTKADTIASRVTTVQLSNTTYELVLHITNHGKKKINAEVWQL